MKHIVTYWAPNTTGEDDFGNPHEGFFQEPMILRAYWPNERDDAVFCGAEVKVGGYLYRGVSTVEDPRGVMGAREIKYANCIPDLRSLGQQWAVILSEASNVAAA